MDPTYSVMVITMALAVVFGPRVIPRLRHLTVLLGCIPTLALMAIGAQIESTGQWAGDFYAAGLMLMLLGPVAAGLVAEALYRRKRRVERRH